jgi:acyl-CoA synthetase (NDP forming)
MRSSSCKNDQRGEEGEMSIDLDPLFNPRSIAVIGASDNLVKWGFIMPRNIFAGGYRGVLHVVNPKGTVLFGRQALRSIKDVPAPVDLALITTPLPTVPDIIAECAACGVRFAIVITAGFSETGTTGAELERQVVAAARAGGIRVAGPNTMGVYSADSNLCCLMPPVRPLKGSVSFVAQSGNLGTQVLSVGRQLGIGFRRFASSGNEGDLRCEDYVEYFGEDPATNVILAYIEGLDDGRRFLRVAKKVTRRKPFIVLKAGDTTAGSRAAASHTGALAGSREIYAGAFKQAGIIRASSTMEMLDLARCLSHLPIAISEMPAGGRVGILTWGGGWGVVAADAAEKAGLDVVSLPHEVIERLDSILPPYWSKANPVDMVGTLDLSLHRKSLEALVECDEIDGVIALGIVGAASAFVAVESFGDGTGIPADMAQLLGEYTKSDSRLQERCVELMRQFKKPIIGVTLMPPVGKGSGTTDALAIYPTPERAVTVMARLFAYRRYLEAH